MANSAPKPYRKLSAGYTWTGRSSLWLAADHLLLAQVVGYAESYKRFFFADIQAIVIRKTMTGMIWNLIWGVLGALIGLMAFQVAVEFGFVIAGIFGLGLLVNTLRGPTCHCHIRTAVQSERVTAVIRLRKARRVLDRIRPLIAAAQGEMSRETLTAHLIQQQPGFTAPAAAAPPVMGG